MKALIVDDDLVSLRLLRLYLEKWGYEVAEAKNGAAAWALFQTDDFPLVIADWMMPEMDGVELVRQIRASQRQGHVYCIVLTARAEKADLVEGMEAGADDFLSKPFDRDELRVRLREGERIVRLERDALKQMQELREAQAALAENEPWARMGRLSTGVSLEIDKSLAAATAELANLRGQLPQSTACLADRILEHLSQARRQAEGLREAASEPPASTPPGATALG